LELRMLLVDEKIEVTSRELPDIGQGLRDMSFRHATIA